MAFSERQTPEDFVPDPDIQAAIKERLIEEKLSCAAAFTIVHAFDVEPIVVGWTANTMDIRLQRCQLGLFGYPTKQGWHNSTIPNLPVPPGLVEALQAARNEDGTLPCAAAWEVASRFETSRMLVGYIADQEGIKITPCQLGAF